MEQYRVLAKYRIHGPDGQKRVFHYHDVRHAGPSIPLAAFHRGERPRPRPPPAPDASRIAARPRITWAEFERVRRDVERQGAERPRRAALTGWSAGTATG